MIYSMITRQKTLLLEYTIYPGNFPIIAREVLEKTDLNKNLSQFCTTNYNFYIFVKDRIVFLVMVKNTYQMRIAFSFLKKIQNQFFIMYDGDTRNSAVPDAFAGFMPNLQSIMEKYNDQKQVDKLEKLIKELHDLQNLSKDNMAIVKIRIQGQNLIKRIQILHNNLLQDTLKRQQDLVSKVRKQKIDRSHLGQQILMNRIILNSWKKLVYDEVICCLKTIIIDSTKIVKDPLHISKECFLAIWSLSYAYKQLQLEQYLNLKQFIPSSLLDSQIEKVNPIIQKYILKVDVSNYERNQYILELLQRKADISLDHINEADHNFSADIQNSPTLNIPNKHKQFKGQNKEKL